MQPLIAAPGNYLFPEHFYIKNKTPSHQRSFAVIANNESSDNTVMVTRRGIEPLLSP